MTRVFFVGGNWKMNGSLEQNKQLIKQFSLKSTNPNEVEVVIAPPAIYLPQLKDIVKGTEIQVSAQNCYLKPNGAYTGEISPQMLKDFEINWVILGHSERREIFKESDELIGQKLEFCLKEGLKVIACIGETLEQREAGETKQVVERQLNALLPFLNKNTLNQVVIAYEPVWAIGTGKVATPEQAQEVHLAIRQYFTEKLGKDFAQKLRIIYGGSVNAQNCKDLAKQPDVDGFLVGGASLKPEFVEIISSYQTPKAQI